MATSSPIELKDGLAFRRRRPLLIAAPYWCLLAATAHLSFWRGHGACERSGCERVIVQFRRPGGFAEILLQSLSELNGEQAVDDGVQAGVDEAEDEEHVAERMGHFALQVVW